MMNGSRIKLTICIPTLNRGPLIGTTLESIVSQATDEVEILVVDGGSNDNTAETVGEFQLKFPSLRYVRANEIGLEHSGTGSVAPSGKGFDRDCNLAVEMALGEYCWLFTDDDLLKPGAISKVLSEVHDQYDLIIVNAEVRSTDLSNVLESSRMKLHANRIYRPSDWENFFSDTADYLTFVGGVVIKREVWIARPKEPYIGTGFIHVGVLLQSPLAGNALVIAEPLIEIRYGDALYMRSSRFFEIWMFLWPQLIWSFPHISDESKSRLCLREPWRVKKTLVNFRAKGSYSKKEYDNWLRSRLASRWERLTARIIAGFPGTLVNFAAVIRFYLIGRPSGTYLTDLLKSPFYFARGFRNPRSSSQAEGLKTTQILSRKGLR